MSRRSTPERIYQAHRAGTLQRLIGEGELAERAERLVSQWEPPAEFGMDRLGPAGCPAVPTVNHSLEERRPARQQQEAYRAHDPTEA